ncbi:MAG: hypothetical protein ACM3ON_07860 [Chloroflexota bacterium]
MKPRAAVLLVIMIVVAVGCSATKDVRYTHDEIKDFPLDVQSRIMKGEVMLGMTPEMVRYAWGPPESVRTLMPFEGKAREEWTYTKFGVYETRKLLFVDGKLFYMVPEPDAVIQTKESGSPQGGGQAGGVVPREQVQETIKLQEPAGK